jgi:iron complex outermembrane receptor protein
MSAVSPSVGVSFAAGRGATLYANVATAFETPTTTELANRPTGAGGFNPELDPQRTVSVEVGGTAQLGRRGLAQLSVYQARIRDALIPFEVEGAPGRVFYRNAGSAVHRGVELGLTVLLLPDVTLRSAYTFTNARFDEYAVAGTSYEDNRVPGVAPHRLDGVLAYTRSDGALGGLFVELEERYLSDVPVNDANTAGTASPAYAITNLRVGFDRVRIGGAELAPFVGINNLFDRDYNTAVSVNAFGQRYYEPGPGRAVYAGIGLAAGIR